VKHPATRIFFCILVCLFVVAGPERLSAEETAVETQRIASIIDKVIDAYGGKEVVEGIHSLYAKGKTEAFMLRDQGRMNFISREKENSV